MHPKEQLGRIWARKRVSNWGAAPKALSFCFQNEDGFIAVFQILKSRPAHHRKWEHTESIEKKVSELRYHHPDICASVFNILLDIFLFSITLKFTHTNIHTYNILYKSDYDVYAVL